jgi:hypothetical protein
MVTEDVAEILVERLADGLRICPQAAADALKAIVEEARRRAGAGDFLSIRDLADRADDVVEQVKAEAGLHLSTGQHGSDKRLATLATLAQQVFAVLAIMGGSGGERDSGYYRASLAHARRLDAMTEGALGLVKLVNLVGRAEDW